MFALILGKRFTLKWLLVNTSPLISTLKFSLMKQSLVKIGELVVPQKVIIFCLDSSKVTMTTILSQWKAGPWKRDVEKTKGTNSILRPVPALRLSPVIIFQGGRGSGWYLGVAKSMGHARGFSLFNWRRCWRITYFYHCISQNHYL